MTTATADAVPTSESLSIKRGLKCKVHVWKPSSDSKSKGLALIYHGFLAHGRYPTVRYAADLLYRNGYTVVAPDLPGHGESEGLKAYIPSSKQLIQDAVEIAKAMITKYNKDDNNNSIFLLGSSMGGAISLAVAMELERQTKEVEKANISGVVLLAPMLAIKVSAPERHLLWALACVIPTIPLIPSSATDSKEQYRDPEKLKECEQDPFSTSGKLRVGSASTCVELATDLYENKLQEVTCPFLCMVAEQDVVVDNRGSDRLYDKSPSTDKTLKRYKALHGLLCEPKPLIDEIENDLMEWISKRTK